MAKRPFTFDTAADPSGLISQGWPNKTACEAWRFAVAVKDWTTLLVSVHGEILDMHALDNGDDPPDIIVRFKERVVGFEMTNLVPEKFAHFEAVIRGQRKNNCTVSPSLSSPAFTSKDDMRNYAVNLDGGWTLTESEVKAWTQEATVKFDKKALKAGKDTYEYLVMFADSSDLSSFEAAAVVSALNQRIQGLTQPLSLILFIWTNHCVYESWLFRKAEAVLRLNAKTVLAY
jgi:hypothetical protein